MAKQQLKKNNPTKKGFILQKLDYRWPVLIAVIAFLLYANTITHDYALDDWGAVTNNQFVQQGIKGIPQILKVDLWHFGNLTLGYYRPLSLITFAIEHEFFDNNPHSSHFINIFLFAITGFVLCLMLTELFQAYHIAFAFLISLLFVAHPIHTEVVANLKSRDELIAFLGVISVVFLMSRHVNSGKKKIPVYQPCDILPGDALEGILYCRSRIIACSLVFFQRENCGRMYKKNNPFYFSCFAFFLSEIQNDGNAHGPGTQRHCELSLCPCKTGYNFFNFYLLFKVVVFASPIDI